MCLTAENDVPCRYTCSSDGGCTTRYAGPPQSGGSSGACFPASSGGSCFGTPSGCQDCNKVKTCSASQGGSANKPKPGENIKYKVVLCL